MSNIKFSQLPNLANITAATIVPVVDAGFNYSVTTANLQAFVNGGNITTGNLSATGNVIGGNVLSSGVISATGTLTGGNVQTAGTVSAAGNVTGGNIVTTGAVSATGNITANYFLGNGSQLTGLPVSYTNANVVTLLATFGSNTVSTTGNVTAGFILGNGSQLTGLPATYTNANVITLLASFGSNTISTTGNITAAFFQGNGSALTGIATSNNVVDLTTNQTVAGNKTFSGTTTLNPYIETTAATVNTGASVTPTMSNGPVQRFTANSNFALNEPSGMVTGQSITLIIRQDGTGSRLMTANAAYRWAYGVKVLSTPSNSIDVISIFYDGTNYLCNLVKGYVS